MAFHFISHFFFFFSFSSSILSSSLLGLKFIHITTITKKLFLNLLNVSKKKIGMERKMEKKEMSEKVRNED